MALIALLVWQFGIQAEEAHAQDRPRVCCISRSTVPLAGGVIIFMSGTNLDSVVSVTFDGVAGELGKTSATELSVVVPPGRAPGPVEVAVLDQSGNAVAAPVDLAYDQPPPSITSIEPDSGPLRGGTSVTITGANLGRTTEITVAGLVADIVSRSATAITFVTPTMRRAGQASVTVRTVSGQSTVRFTVLDPPQITYARPSEIPLSGARSITVFGSKLSGVSSVKVDGAAVQYTLMVDRTGQGTLVFQMPARDRAGPARLSITSPQGQVESLDVLTYVAPPTISSVSPSSVYASGGTTTMVRLEGTGLTNVAVSTKGGPIAPALVAEDSRGKWISFPAPQAGPGPVTLIVSNDFGRATATLNYYVDPTVSVVSPDSGSSRGGELVTIRGTELDRVTGVLFGGQNAEILTATANVMTVRTPPSSVHGIGTGEVSITLSTERQPRVVTFQTYLYLDPPSITAVQPPSGQVVGGEQVRVVGSNLDTVDLVLFGARAGTILRQSARELLVRTPSSPLVNVGGTWSFLVGPVSVWVRSNDGRDELVKGFTYVDSRPVVREVAPSSGSRRGGGEVTLTGSFLDTVSSVRFGGLEAAIVSTSPDFVVVRVPATTEIGPVQISAANEFGVSLTSTTYLYEFRMPGFAAVSPSTAPWAGGTRARISGANLDEVTDVKFGAASATIVSRSPLEIEVVVPPADEAGATVSGGEAVTLQVTNPDASIRLWRAFRYVPPAPTITEVSPDAGSLRGGSRVTITGANFLAGTRVLFSDRQAGIISRTEDRLVISTPASSTAGLVDVQVITLAGQASRINGYAYLPPPTITRVLPPLGATDGGNLVIIQGSNLDSTELVTFGGLEAAVVSRSPGVLAVTAPAAQKAGEVAIQVVNPSGWAGSTYEYLLPPPMISSVDPASGPVSGGTEVLISGSRLTAGMKVQFGSVLATVIQADATGIRARTPTAATDGAVSVTVSEGSRSATLTSGFTYLSPAPTITGISPISGDIRGGTRVTITGSNFLPGTTVLFDGEPSTVESLVEDRLVVSTPSRSAPGAVEVQIRTSGGQASRAGAFEYLDLSPVVRTVTPSAGPLAGGTEVVLSGSNLEAVSEVKFGDAAQVRVAEATDRELSVRAPAASTSGPVDLTVSGRYGSAVIRAGFTYLDPPVVNSIQPPSGAISGGEQVRVDGAGFTAQARVSFGREAARVISWTTTRLVVEVPGATSPGMVDVRVATAGGQGSLTNGYEYRVPAPVIDGIGPRNGPLAGGNEVRITGRHLDSVYRVTFDGLPASIQSKSQGSIEVLAPQGGQPGRVDVIVTSEHGSDRAAGAYTYRESQSQDDDRITVTGYAPTSGPMSGGTAITITGSRLDLITGANMGSRAARIVAQSTSSITIISPSADSDYAVNIVLEHRKGGVEAGRFQYTG